jgi:hypothetical protein
MGRQNPRGHSEPPKIPGIDADHASDTKFGVVFERPDIKISNSEGESTAFQTMSLFKQCGDAIELRVLQQPLKRRLVYCCQFAVRRSRWLVTNRTLSSE